MYTIIGLIIVAFIVWYFIKDNDNDDDCETEWPEDTRLPY